MGFIYSRCMMRISFGIAPCGGCDIAVDTVHCNINYSACSAHVGS